MNHFESIIIPIENDSLLQSSRDARLKMGEIIHCGKVYAFICIHCSTEFENSHAFCDHAEMHLMDAFRNRISVFPGAKRQMEEFRVKLDVHDSNVDEDPNEAESEFGELGEMNIEHRDANRANELTSSEESPCPPSAYSDLQAHLQVVHERMYSGQDNYVDR